MSHMQSMTETTQSTTELINLLENVDVDAFLNEIEENEESVDVDVDAFLNEIEENEKKEYMHLANLYTKNNSKSDESKSEYQKEEEEVNNNGIGGKQNERKPKVHILGNVKELKECNEDQMVDLVNEICDKTSELISQKHIFVSYFKENNI
eukprot:350640_1